MARHLATLLAIVAGGCTAGGGGDDGGYGDDGDPPDITPEAFVEQLIAADCTEAFACEAQFPPAQGDFNEEWGDTESDCLTDDDDYLTRDDIAAAVAAGRIIFNARAAETCLADHEYPSACADFFTSTTGRTPATTR